MLNVLNFCIELVKRLNIFDLILYNDVINKIEDRENFYVCFVFLERIYFV